MSEAKKPRVMSAKRFATAKLSSRATAEGFLSAHRTFLDGYDFLSPLLQAYDEEQLLPTPTLQAIQSALMTHYLESERKTQEAKLAQGKESKAKKQKSDESLQEPAPTKPYTITLMCKVMDRQGNLTIQVGTVKRTVMKMVEKNGEKVSVPHIVEEPAEWGATDFGSAQRLADRRLFHHESSEFAIIRNNYDRPIDTIVHRDDAIARILRPNKGPVSRVRGKSTSSLGFGIHAKQTRVVGPWSHR